MQSTDLSYEIPLGKVYKSTPKSTPIKKVQKKGPENMLLEALKALILLNCTIWSHVRRVANLLMSNTDVKTVLKPANAIN